MENENSLAIVLAWQVAANAQDAERLVALSAPNIEMVGPRGSGYGSQLLREWLERAGLSLTTVRAFVRGDVVVLAQRGVWRAASTGDITGERDLASRFRIEASRVAQFARYDDLDDALREGGLSLKDEVALPN